MIGLSMDVLSLEWKREEEEMKGSALHISGSTEDAGASAEGKLCAAQIRDRCGGGPLHRVRVRSKKVI